MHDDHHGGDPTRHRPTADLDAAFAAMTPPPRDVGRVMALVSRPGKEQRQRLAQATLTVNGGMPGDRWVHKPEPNPHTQLAAMNATVGDIIRNGQSVALFGDNLVLDLDLSEANLPVGTTIKMGGATLEVTPEPHTGCAKYKARFGGDALKWISAKDRRDRRLRGVYVRVVEAGEVREGDKVEVLSRG